MRCGGRAWLPRADLHDMAVRVADEARARERGVACEERGLPVDQVVRALVRRIEPPIARREVLEQLDARTMSGVKRRDAQSRTEHVVEVLLLGTVVLALAHHREPEPVAVEAEARLRVADD